MLEDAGRPSLDGVSSTLGNRGIIGRPGGGVDVAPRAAPKEELARFDASRILSAFAHDMRQPLTSIRMNVQTVLRLLRERPPRTAHIVAALQDTLAAEGAATNVLLAARARVAGLTQVPRGVDLNAIVADVQRLLRAATATWGERLELDLDPRAPNVEAEPHRLRRTISKLVLAALDAMDANGAIVPGRLALRTSKGDGRFAELRLQGMVPASLDANRDWWTHALGAAATQAQACYTIVESLTTGLTVRVFLPVAGNDEGTRDADGRG